jgi:hypothetical protein
MKNPIYEQFPAKSCGHHDENNPPENLVATKTKATGITVVYCPHCGMPVMSEVLDD